MCKKTFFFLTPLLYCASLYAEADWDRPQGPWLTGSLLTPSAQTVPYGHFAIEPYLFTTRIIGSYDSDWKSHSQNKSTSITLQTFIQAGLTSFMDFQVFPYVVYTNKKGHTATRFGDLRMRLNFKLYREQPEGKIPSVKFTIAEEFPTGHYNNLNPQKLGVDASGGGVYVTSFGLTFGKLIDLGGAHFFRPRLNFSYTIPTSTHVNGFNVYGGGFGAHGKIRPGNEFFALLGLEYTWTLHWAFALDVVAISTKKGHFSGFPGVLGGIPEDESIDDDQPPPFSLASTGLHSSEQYSIAPAIEYNFTQRIGLIAGSWFSVAGRNSARFVNAAVALSVFF